MSNGAHIPHHHMRKKKRRTAIDRWIYPIALVSPIMTIPQLLDIWVGKNVQGVSLITWSTYAVVAFFWLIYGIYHKQKPIIVTNGIFIFLNSLIALGVYLYS